VQLDARQAGTCSHPTFLTQGSDAELLEGMQVGVRGVHMDLQEPGDVRGAVPGGKEQERFRPAAPPGR